jgi:hypothetical protein
LYSSVCVVCYDHNGDGWMDVFIANDSMANALYVNKRDGTFEDIAVSAGAAYGEDGEAEAGMGVAAVPGLSVLPGRQDGLVGVGSCVRLCTHAFDPSRPARPRSHRGGPRVTFVQPLIRPQAIANLLAASGITMS